MNQTLIQAIAQKVDYLKRCEGNPKYEKFTDVARAKLDKLLGHLPSGSGIDAGTKLEWDSSRPNCIRFSCGYHHMDDAGYYDGWTHHMIIVTPTFAGFDLRITGRDRNAIKDYLYDTYDYVFKSKVTADGDLVPTLTDVVVEGAPT